MLRSQSKDAWRYAFCSSMVVLAYEIKHIALRIDHVLKLANTK
jgi:hypothetical protein